MSILPQIYYVMDCPSFRELSTIDNNRYGMYETKTPWFQKIKGGWVNNRDNLRVQISGRRHRICMILPK